MNTGLFRFFRFENWAWSKLTAGSYDHYHQLWFVRCGPIVLLEERPRFGLSIGEVRLLVGPFEVILGRGFLGNE